MVRYQLNLDYDDADLDFLAAELIRLKIRFPKVTFRIYESSKDCYHLRSNQKLDYERALEILNFSRCSHDYKTFCRRVKSFPIRTSEKIWFKEDGVVVKPIPQLM